MTIHKYLRSELSFDCYVCRQAKWSETDQHTIWSFGNLSIHKKEITTINWDELKPWNFTKESKYKLIFDHFSSNLSPKNGIRKWIRSNKVMIYLNRYFGVIGISWGNSLIIYQDFCHVALNWKLRTCRMP